MDNRWNKVVYKLWSPLYDLFFNSGIFLVARRKVFENIEFTSGQKTLLVGAGTGADLSFLIHHDMDITAIDLSADMLNKARQKYRSSNITFLEMDAQSLAFPSNSFDTVIANLILSVVPDPNRCFGEIIRVTRQGGQIIIFDKFVPSNQKLSIFKRMIRPIVAVLGTDIGRRFENIVMPYRNSVSVEADLPVLFDGMYRKILLRKKAMNNE
ncbi:class I SAM-dependent methyltransferase [Paenactinomyces guangxiensis]|uniref:Class I SAM-dependent methyltransferase n=1 Tax=Paenactinomyces guangxiensis TaxID=1490290 RepID=A0A7W1WSW8_9BACL|nr:class I SAM-dependent methyltransferase [Paenactinomyces guangxiensis]MBA4495442.1 class I SAM-dependent methyltransferase [Paenactinomyces guangxiensis]MBH8592437.1 class I SAM-dependent methyltransferase [Paenactinomyces guangxiensis]